MLDHAAMVQPDTEARCTRAALAGGVMDRRHFLRGSVAAAVAGICGAAAGAEQDADAEADPKGLLDALDKISAGSRLQRSDQGRDAIPIMRRYITSLQGDRRRADMSELARAADLAITRLYFSQEEIQERTREGAGELPFATIDLEAALVAHLRLLGRSSSGGSGVSPQNLIGRLRADMLWYNCYDNTPAVWEHAALHYRTLFLPGDGPVSLRQFSDFLQELPKLHAIATRAVSGSYNRLGLDLDRQLLAVADGPGARQDLLKQWRNCITLFHGHLLLEADNPRSLPEKDAEAFRRWHQERLVAPYIPAIRQLLLQHTSAQERQIIGQSLADGVLMEDGLDAAMTQVRRWGLSPEDAITAVSLSRPSAEGTQKQMGQSTCLFLDMYRGAVGGEQWLSGTQAEQRRLREPAVQRVMRRNSAPVFLSALQGLANREHTWDAINEETEESVGAFMFLAQEGMKGEVSRMNGLPDLSEWGERAGLFLSVQGGGSHALTPEEWLRAKGRMLKPILVSGFPLRDTLGNDTGQRVPGVFRRHEERLAEDLCRQYGITHPERRQRVPGSPLFQEQAARDRSAFLTSFREAAPGLAGADELLKEWGFTQEELAAASTEK